MILLVDNYDSFTFNVVQQIATLTEEPVRVVRNDEAGAQELLELRPAAVVISPGPGTPERSGVTLELVERARDVPLLGVCLGHQALAVAAGAEVVRAPEPVHGKTEAIFHRGEGLFAGLEDPFEATRYHSLVVDRSTVPDQLEIDAWTEDGLVMGLRHRQRPHYGVQFHPESYLTRSGSSLMRTFLELAGVSRRPGPATGGGST